MPGEQCDDTGQRRRGETVGWEGKASWRRQHLGQVFKVGGIHLNMKEPTKHRVEWGNARESKEAPRLMQGKRRHKVAEIEDRGK